MADSIDHTARTARLRETLEGLRDHLFVFLDHEKVEATSNRAERRLRPAVMRRILTVVGTPRRRFLQGRLASILWRGHCRQT